MKILVAAHNETTRQTLVDVLESCGYAPVAAGDGPAAMRALQSEDAPAVIMSDWNLPGIDGPTLCKTAKAAMPAPHTPPYCILITPHATFGETVLSLDLGADDYLPAIFNTEELLSTVRAAARIVLLQEQLAGARAALEFECTHDQVTGVFNRAGLQQQLVRELERARRFGTKLGAMLVDVDHFRVINENFGCFAGDAVLHDLARRIHAVVRAYDVIGRYGATSSLCSRPRARRRRWCCKRSAC